MTGASDIVTDESWKLRESPLTPVGSGRVFGDYGGEKYDAGLELPGWNTVGLDDASWQSAAVFEPAQVPATAPMVEPNRIVETIKAVKVQTFDDGGWIIDMGKNFTGWLEIRLPAIPKGTTVKLEYSDQLERDKPAPDTIPALRRDESLRGGGGGRARCAGGAAPGAPGGPAEPGRRVRRRRVTAEQRAGAAGAARSRRPEPGAAGRARGGAVETRPRCPTASTSVTRSWATARR